MNLNVTEIIRSDEHLGIPTLLNNDGSLASKPDIDAFEFVWLIDQYGGRFGLTLLFSVDDDDPLTANDETGGLDPAMIYASYLNGSYFEFTADIPEVDDIDAIACWRSSLEGKLRNPNNNENNEDKKTGELAPGGKQLEVFPVPATDFVTIQFQVDEPAWYAVYDLKGQQLETGKLKFDYHALNIGNYAPGTYLMQVLEGERIYTARFVKH